MKKLFSLLIFLILGVNTSYASVKISLITCGPTDEYVFYLYGHTALRVQENGTDLVYNYGYFSPSQKNFILNFMLGKPMYSLGVVPFEDFLIEYQLQGRSVVELELNLKEHEAVALAEKLVWNALPENRDYQYNFYFDNCATRPRDLIEEAVGGIEYHTEGALPTFREAIRDKSHTATWYTIGADLCLGWKSDQRMTVRDAAFLPELLEQEMLKATRKDTGAPMVINKTTWAPQAIEIANPLEAWQLPHLLFVALLIIYYLLWRKGPQKAFTILRKGLYLLLGIGGVVIWFLALISEHPHTFPNANMLFLHPFWLILTLPGKKRKSKRIAKWLYFGNFVAIIVYLLMGQLQALPYAIPLWALVMLMDQWLSWQKCRRKNVDE